MQNPLSEAGISTNPHLACAEEGRLPGGKLHALAYDRSLRAPFNIPFATQGASRRVTQYSSNAPAPRTIIDKGAALFSGEEQVVKNKLLVVLLDYFAHVWYH